MSTGHQPRTHVAHLGQQPALSQTSTETHIRRGPALEPPPNTGTKFHPRPQQERVSADPMGSECSRRQGSGTLPALECSLEGEKQTGPRWKISVEETQRIIKSSQAMTCPWRTGKKTPGRAGEGPARVSGTGLGKQMRKLWP